MKTFNKVSRIAAPAEAVFSWHETAEAFEKLLPPWENIRIVERSNDGIKSGTKVTIEMRLGPFRQQWVALHTAYEQGHMFRDEQLAGPFCHWIHTHKVEPNGPSDCFLIDEIEYKLPFGFIGELLGGWLTRKKLEKLFEFRHRVTREACERRAKESIDNGF